MEALAVGAAQFDRRRKPAGFDVTVTPRFREKAEFVKVLLAEKFLRHSDLRSCDATVCGVFLRNFALNGGRL